MNGIVFFVLREKKYFVCQIKFPSFLSLSEMSAQKWLTYMDSGIRKTAPNSRDATRSFCRAIAVFPKTSCLETVSA
jgi:hypothetical protein